jgi:HemY protein
MRAALWVLALFALAVAFTLAARLDQGYVIIVYPPWRLELSFVLALLLLTGLVTLAFALLHLARIALNLPDDVRAWREKRHQHKADQALLAAVRAYLNGDLQQAANLAGQAADSSLAPDLVERLQRPLAADAGKTPPAA